MAGMVEIDFGKVIKESAALIRKTLHFSTVINYLKPQITSAKMVKKTSVLHSVSLKLN